MKNYNQMSKKNRDQVDIVETVDTDETDVVETVEPAVDETPVDTEPVEPAKPEPIGGTVDCAKLNVRSEATVESEPVGIINRDTKVFIYEDESTDEFYKVCTATGLEGYCMKKFISVQ